MLMFLEKCNFGLYTKMYHNVNHVARNLWIVMLLSIIEASRFEYYIFTIKKPTDVLENENKVMKNTGSTIF